MTLRARALDELEDLLDQPRAVQDARLAALRQSEPELALEVHRLLEADRGAANVTDARIDGVVGRAAAHFDTPEHLGAYKVLREIGRGGMGIVYEAEQLRPRRRVALKTMPTLGFTADARARLELEVQALANVQHPGIPQVYELFEHDGRPIIAMEIVRGDTLDVALAHADLRDAAGVLQRVAEAIAWVHERGVVHRDLKPSNILVDAEGQPKVLDFGIAALGGPSSRAEGTPRYMAPEQREARLQDARVDIYALGVMAREVLGETRFRPDELRALLDRATADDPLERTASAKLLAEDLRRWRTLQPLRTVRTSALRRLHLLARRSPVALTLSSVAGLLSLVGVGVLASDALSAWDAQRIGHLQAQSAERGAASRLAELRDWEEREDATGSVRRQRFADLVNDPALLGTHTLSDAWTAWAEGEPHMDLMLSALGQAWVHAMTPEQERRTRTQLAVAAWERGRWVALEHLADGIEHALPVEAAQAVWFRRGDFESVRAALPPESAPLATLLDQARWERRPSHARLVLGPHWIRAESGMLHVGDAFGEETEHVRIPDGRTHLYEEGGDVVVQVRGMWGLFRPGTGQGSVEFTSPAVSRAEVHGELADGGTYAVTTVEDGVQIDRTVRGDVERVLLDRDQVGRGALGQPQVLDVDGDGSDELIIVANGWRDTGLQVWDLDESPPRLLSHRPHVPYRARTLSHDPPVLAVSEAAPGTTPRPFLPELPPPARTARILRWTDGDWEVVHELFQRGRLSGVQRADLDGDGSDDLILAAQDLTLVYRGLGDTRFSTPLLIPDGRAPMLVQADDDPALELWLLGTEGPGLLLGLDGAGPLPPPPTEPPAVVRTPSAVIPPAAQRRWNRLARLAEIGFVAQALRGLEDLGREPAPVGTDALLWGLVLAEGRPDVQRRLAHQLLAHDDARAEHVHVAMPVLRSAVHEVPDAPTRSWSGPEWPFEVLRPQALRAELDGSVDLVFDANTSPVLTLPVQASGGPVALSMSVSITDLDFGSGVEVEIATASGEAVLQLLRVGGGPAHEHRLAVRCGARGALTQRLPEVPTDAVIVKLSWDPSAGTLVCRAGETWLRREVELGPPDRLRFTLGARPSGFGPLTRMGLHLTDLTLSGAAPASDEVWRPDRLASDELDPALRAQRWGRRGLPQRADLAPLEVVVLARLLREDPDGWLSTIRSQRPDDWVEALRLSLDGPDGVDPPLVVRVLRSDLLADLDPMNAEHRALIVLAASSRLDVASARSALGLVQRIPETVDDPQVWALRVRLYTIAGDPERRERALQRWQALARPGFSVGRRFSIPR